MQVFLLQKSSLNLLPGRIFTDSLLCFYPKLKISSTITNVEIRNKTLTFFISKIEGRYICEQAPLITKNLGQKIEKGKPQQ